MSLFWSDEGGGFGDPGQPLIGGRILVSLTFVGKYFVATNSMNRPGYGSGINFIRELAALTRYLANTTASILFCQKCAQIPFIRLLMV